MLRCSENGGLLIVIKTERTVDGTDVDVHSCLSFRLLSEDDWNVWITDAKQESRDRQEVRRKAIHQTINSNQKEDALIY